MAIREFTQFGSGFRIAMRDLEIRGAGNLLGPEQSGHMEAVGYDLYCKIINGALREARGEKPQKDIDTVMELPLAASIPHSYIRRETDRLAMYKRIAHISTQEELYDVQDELIDRYGEIPKPVENLLFIGKLKSDAQRAYITRIQVRDGEAKLLLDPEAPMDGAKLFQAIQGVEGVQFRPGEQPVLLLHRPKQDAAAICRSLPQIVYMLGDCIQPET